MQPESDLARFILIDAALSEALRVAQIDRMPTNGEPSFVSWTRTRIIKAVTVAVSQGSRNVGEIRVQALREAFWCCSNELWP